MSTDERKPGDRIDLTDPTQAKTLSNEDLDKIAGGFTRATLSTSITDGTSNTLSVKDEDLALRSITFWSGSSNAISFDGVAGGDKLKR